MADLLDLIQSQLSGDALNAIAKQVGGNQQQTTAAVTAALPMIMQALNKNAQNKKGAASLFNAVEKDHDGSALNNITDMIGNFQNGPGAGIIKHVFGPKQNNAENMVSQASGLNPQATANIMKILAPLVMGQLGQQKKQNGLDIGGLVNLLNTNSNIQQKKNPKSTSLLNKFLDKDGDGKINDDLANMGLKAIGNFFKRKK